MIKKEESETPAAEPVREQTPELAKISALVTGQPKPKAPAPPPPPSKKCGVDGLRFFTVVIRIRPTTFKFICLPIMHIINQISDTLPKDVSLLLKISTYQQPISMLVEIKKKTQNRVINKLCLKKCHSVFQFSKSVKNL